MTTIEPEMIKRFIVTVDGIPVGLYDTNKVAEAVANEVNGTVYYIDAVEDCVACLVFISRYNDRSRFNTEYEL